MADGEKFGVKSIVEGSDAFQALKNELYVNAVMSRTGITNFVVNHEDPALVEAFLKFCFDTTRLYHHTVGIDAVELEYGAPGVGNSTKRLDELIYGTFKLVTDPSTGAESYEYDQKTGRRVRNSDGFVSRTNAKNKMAKDRFLIINNLDFSKDFCPVTPGVIERSLWVLDKFRDPNLRNQCKIILVTNKPIRLPFNTRVVEIPRVNAFSANTIIDNYINAYKEGNYEVEFAPSQRQHIVRKLIGMTYTNGADTLAQAMQESRDEKSSAKRIDTEKVVRVLRKKINASLMRDGVGLTHLSPRPWEDYICPETSSFTYDVMKILRDLEEIKRLNAIKKKMEDGGIEADEVVSTIESLQSRIPHVIVLYGKGGVGKSAFPVHLAGLLDFDVWDFNINATHDMYVGEGARKMREALSMISKTSHIILRIDEYDRAIGSAGVRGEGMHEAHKQVESEFMNWLQNSQEESLFRKQNIFVVMTTNHKENITGPLLRSGRADLVIDISNFDSQSLKETFATSARRMFNRGIKVIGFGDQNELQNAINDLDLDTISEIAMVKGFTVRDVETLILEMAAHRYYLANGQEGLPWDSETFIKVVENSQGSTREDCTGEFVLGDRFLDDAEAAAEVDQLFLDLYGDIETTVDDDGNIAPGFSD